MKYDNIVALLTAANTIDIGTMTYSNITGESENINVKRILTSSVKLRSPSLLQLIINALLIRIIPEEQYLLLPSFARLLR